MSKVLVLANLELSYEFPDGATDPEELVRRQERRLLRLLRKLVETEAGVAGSLERLELESFSYASSLEGEPTGYYYNKHEKAETN